MTIYKKFCALLFLVSDVVSAASFDCLRVTGTDEKAVCANRQLSDLDVEMAVKYHWLSGLAGMGVAGDMRDSQQLWLQKRRACGGDTDCLHTLYLQRIQALNRIYDAIPKPVI
ncbi:hypothetical protein BH006_06785 [Salmonella enterica]|uniref:DUF1311 domain-containing protein n=1 Tax=Salmonella enterica TaxID=28901 RepID=A0A3F3I8S2_SALER|nr:hypothetical protein [Salmonella enterica]EDQ9731860.1 hypothetical protein [Salmonella enterica subsp. enterica]OEH95555.1 hypothetical protein BH006_06785 [Salmonella enterica]